MTETTRLEQRPENTESANNPVLELLGDQMNHLEINASTGGGGVGVGIPEIVAFKDKWEGQLN